MVPDKLLAKDEEMKSLLKAVDTDKVISIDDTEKRQSTQTKLEKQTSCPPDKQMTLTEEMINNQISKLVEDALNISDDLSSLQDPENESKDECQDVPTTEIVIKEDPRRSLNTITLRSYSKIKSTRRKQNYRKIWIRWI